MSDEARNCAECMDALGVGWSWSGLCLWLGPEAERHAGELAALGARWSVKRGAWYFRLPSGSW